MTLVRSIFEQVGLFERRVDAHTLLVTHPIHRNVVLPGRDPFGKLPDLERLTRNGLVEKEVIDRRTNCYTLTGRGCCEITVSRELESQYVADIIEQIR